MAICSDIDGTTTLERFLAIQEFLNTTRNTSVGPGIGLEIGNSFFPYTPDDSFAYFSSRPADREVIETLIKTGYIDCLHSYGDGARSRADALRALEEFEHSRCKLDVWVNHAQASSNFGKDTAPGVGDVVGSPVYHADATLAYGIKFVWKGRLSSVVGHGVPFTLASFRRILDRAHPGHTALNIARELAKTALAYAGNRRFAIHRHNQLLRVDRLEDGQRIYEFKRCNNHWRGISHGADCAGLAYVIRPKALADLIAAEGYMVIYTHLGVGPDHPPFIPIETRSALRGLAETYQAGDIYVTTTSRLLNYYLNHRYLQWSHEFNDEGATRITIRGVADPIAGPRLPKLAALQGITFYVPDRHRARLYLNGHLVSSIVRNPADYTGRESISIPRTYLICPLTMSQDTSFPVVRPAEAI